MTNRTSNNCFASNSAAYIRSERFIMEFAASAPEALERAKKIGDPLLILILSDINMPGMSGLEMLPKVKAARPNVR